MDVTVKLQGVEAPRDPNHASGISLALRDGATAGDLMGQLAARFGAPFCEALDDSNARLPRHIRVFCDGQMLASLEQPLVETGARSTRVSVVVLSPMMGG